MFNKASQFFFRYVHTMYRVTAHIHLTSGMEICQFPPLISSAVNVAIRAPQLIKVGGD